MIVCPACRGSNDEDAQACASCGASLAPGTATLAARRPATERPEIVIPARRPPSRWRPVIVLGTVIATTAAAGAFLLLRPDPCRERTFVSPAFGYCVDTPEGWTASPARFGSVSLDQFAADDADGTIVVEAIDLPSESSLPDLVEAIRALDAEAGLSTGGATPADVAGVAALTWDATGEATDGTSYRTREVVVIVGEVAWRISLNETEAGFEDAARALEDLLATWRFS